MQVIHTQNGDVTLYLPDLDETYHSRHGAILESQHVFIENGLKRIDFSINKDLNILEVGFGTGLNALLSYLFAKENDVQIQYHSLEPFPVSLEVISQIDYGKKLNVEEVFTKLHQEDWNMKNRIAAFFTLHKIQQKIQDFQALPQFYDVIYFDAFAKSKQPEIWEYEVLRKMRDSLKKGGVFVTYAATGQLRRDLINLGFKVENPKGAHFKREMTVGLL
jgi:tRNA U34 5-methylaminomethyl-2-thiouridine-forming methyltransferase MnmC